MDLHEIVSEPTPDERDALDAVLGPPKGGWDGGERSELDGHGSRGGHAARTLRHLLLPALHAAQARAGWISPGALGYICRRLTVPPAEAYGVASFYALFSQQPRPGLVAHVCDDVACIVGGAEQLCRDLEDRMGPEGTAIAAGAEEATWYRSPCLGQCERGMAALVVRSGRDPDEHVFSPTSAEHVLASLVGVGAKSAGGLAQAESAGPQRSGPTAEPAVLPQAGDPDLVLLRRIGAVDPASLDDYRSRGGYQALRTAVALGPAGVIREVSDAKLLGRGGAAFPTGRKWEAVASRPERPHYLVCNADESEPGTFKDRILMEGDPYAVLEAMTIAGYATGCERGYLYIRGEYPLAARRVQAAIVSARAHGLLGSDIMGEGFVFDVELRRGAGAYICGEETALFNSIEGKRGEPRNKPPFPVQVGLFGKPTVVNNVETLVNVLGIVRDGGQAYAAVGTADSTGTRLFCLSGAVARPGLYEVPFGTRLGELLELAGGVREARALRAILLGGAAGSFVTSDQLDLPLSFEATAAAGLTLGSGVLVVLDDTVDLWSVLARIARFFRDESCGQCVPCRVGTVRQEELVERLASGRSLGTTADELALLSEIEAVMRDASICGLGQTAASAIQSAFRRLPALLHPGRPLSGDPADSGAPR